MKTLNLFCKLSVAALFLVAPLNAQTGDVGQGAAVYGNTCGTCHNARSPLERTDRQWIVISNHMRVRANLTGRQLRDVLSFLRATNNDPGQAVQLAGLPADQPVTDFSNEISSDAAVIARGLSLVTDKACVGCHVIGDVGGAVGPNLNTVFSSRDATFVRRKLADPTFNNAASMMPNFGLTAEEIDALVAYLASLDGH